MMNWDGMSQEKASSLLQIVAVNTRANNKKMVTNDKADRSEDNEKASRGGGRHSNRPKFFLHG
ncbi:MAG: hypothetical protein KDB03_03700 [Planctomycetales bacterium]|nr:hypothetical protein [Planctomycetales bacterium]